MTHFINVTIRLDEITFIYTNTKGKRRTETIYYEDCPFAEGTIHTTVLAQNRKSACNCMKDTLYFACKAYLATKYREVEVTRLSYKMSGDIFSIDN